MAISHMKPVRNVGRRSKMTAGNMPTWHSLLIASFRKGRHEPFNPLLNRHTGEPHQGGREIARRLRQSA